MTADWLLVPLSEIVNFKTGKLDSNASEEGGTYPFFTCSPTTLAINTYAFDTEAVLLAGNNANGIFPIKYYDGKFNAYQRTYVITPICKNKVSVRWLYFRIQHVTSELQQMSVGTATKFLTRKILDAYEVLLPPLKKQEEIADILWSIQNKIELNRQTNQTLEHIAQAIFKSWFVDFEPTRAKIIAKELGAEPATQELAAQAIICGAITLEQLAELEESLRTSLPVAINDKLSQPSSTPISADQLIATAALFPNQLVESELGQVPEGWEVLGFKSIVEKNIDNRGKTPPTTDNGIPLLEVKYLPEGSIKPDLNTSKYVDDETYNTWFRAHLEPEDIIISTVGTIGRICMVPNGEKMTIAQNLLGMRFNLSKASPYFMYYQMNSFRFRHDVDARLVITVQASIKRKDLDTIDLLVPSVELQNEYEKIIKPLVLMQHSDQVLALEKIRDTLLPKLLSGELTIEAAE